MNRSRRTLSSMCIICNDRQWKVSTLGISGRHKGFLLSGIALLATAVLSAGLADAQQPQIAGIGNAAPVAQASGNVARGELISIYGSGLANGVASSFDPASLTPSLAGASVSIGGLVAPVTYASPTQLDVQVPFRDSGRCGIGECHCHGG